MSVIDSLRYILLCGVAALRWRRLRAARAFVPQPDCKEFVSGVRYTSDRERGPTAGRPHGVRIRGRESGGFDFGVKLESVGGPEERGPHRRGDRGHGEVRAWWVTKTGDTLDWLGCRAFGVEEFRAEPGRQGVRVLGVGEMLKLLRYNCQSGLRPSVGGGSGPLGTRDLVPFHKEFLFTSHFVCRV